jgi:hypothetical protein
MGLYDNTTYADLIDVGPNVLIHYFEHLRESTSTR